MNLQSHWRNMGDAAALSIAKDMMEGYNLEGECLSLYGGSDFIKRLPLHCIPKIYNEFPDFTIKNISSKITFKDQLKLFYLNSLNAEVFCGRPYCRDCFGNSVL